MSATMNRPDPPRPWYREPWPWFLMALPAAAIIGGAVTLWLAIASDDGMVARDYYKRGLAINRELARSERASQLGLRARLDLSGDRVRVRVSATQTLPPETTLRLSLVHPGQRGADRTLVLARVSGDATQAEYSGRFEDDAPLPAAAWQVVLESASWRLDGQLRRDGERQIVLEAASR